MGLISKSFYQPYTPFKAHHVCSSVHIKQTKLLMPVAAQTGVQNSQRFVAVGKGRAESQDKGCQAFKMIHGKVIGHQS